MDGILCCGGGGFDDGAVGARGWGIQFHLETDEQVLEAMLSGGAGELREAGVDAGRIRTRAREELPRLRERALAVFGRWADLF